MALALNKFLAKKSVHACSEVRRVHRTKRVDSRQKIELILAGLGQLYHHRFNLGNSGFPKMKATIFRLKLRISQHLKIPNKKHRPLTMLFYCRVISAAFIA